MEKLNYKNINDIAHQDKLHRVASVTELDEIRTKRFWKTSIMVVNYVIHPRIFIDVKKFFKGIKIDRKLHWKNTCEFLTKKDKSPG